jgi:hypothetical protein
MSGGNPELSIKVRSLVTSVTLVALATIADAGLSIQYWQALSQESQFKALKAGEYSHCTSSEKDRLCKLWE